VSCDPYIMPGPAAASRQRHVRKFYHYSPLEPAEWSSELLLAILKSGRLDSGPLDLEDIPLPHRPVLGCQISFSSAIDYNR